MPHRLGYVEPIDLTPRRPRVWRSGPCDWCGTYFNQIDQVAARFCSKKCAKRSERSRRDHRFRVAPKIRKSIYERDKWICQLCFDPVDPTLPKHDRWAATLDHIECQSWALVPDDRPENLRLAHRMCNSIRGNRQLAA